jgi:hypothetical protein
MSVLELKGELHDMLAQVNEESQLQQIRALLFKLLPHKNGGETYPDGLTKEQYEELLLAIEESEDEANLISTEEMFKRYEPWLGK